MAVESHGYQPPEVAIDPESKTERRVIKAKEYIARVIKVWSDSAEQNRHSEYFQSQDAMQAKVDIGDYIRHLAICALNNEPDNDVNTVLDVIGNRLYELWHLEANSGQYITSEPGSWRHEGVKAVMKALMRKVGFQEDRVEAILPDGERGAGRSDEASDRGNKIIDRSEEFAKRAIPGDVGPLEENEQGADGEKAESVAGQ